MKGLVVSVAIALAAMAVLTAFPSLVEPTEELVIAVVFGTFIGVFLHAMFTNHREDEES